VRLLLLNMSVNSATIVDTSAWRWSVVTATRVDLYASENPLTLWRNARTRPIDKRKTNTAERPMIVRSPARSRDRSFTSILAQQESYDPTSCYVRGVQYCASEAACRASSVLRSKHLLYRLKLLQWDLCYLFDAKR
jgi:hypothetical protein